MKVFPYTAQTLDQDDHLALIKCFEQDWITRGPQVKAFEKAISEYCNVPYVVSFNSGTSALTAASYAAEINSEDLIVSSPNTFVGTLSGALKRTRHLYFTDIDLKTGCGDFNHFPQTKDQRVCQFPVLYSGIAREIKKSPGGLLIEDACQAFGSSYLSGEKVGSCPQSDMTVFSFHPAKSICMGEGGAVTTKSKAYYEKLLLFRNNGIVKTPDHDPWAYDVMDLTDNHNVTEFQATLGLSQLSKIESFLKQRRTLVRRYKEHLNEVEHLTLLTDQYDAHSAHNLFPIQIDFEALGVSRKELMLELKSLGVLTQVHFIPLYHHPYFKKHYDFNRASFPNMERYYERTLSFPLYSHLKIEEVDFVCATLKTCLEKRCLPYR